jgi:hypothetical protein
VWLLEFANGVMTRVTFKGGWAPLFSRDGRQFVLVQREMESERSSLPSIQPFSRASLDGHYPM